MPAALALERFKPRDRRPRHHRQRNALLNVRYLAVPGRQQRRAHRTWALTLRAIHIVVDDERILVAEQVGKRRWPRFALESIILLDLAARRQRPALLGDALDVTAKLDLLGQQRFAGAAVFGALVGKADATGPREFGGGFQGGTALGFRCGTAHGMTSLRWSFMVPRIRRSGRGRSDMAADYLGRSPRPVILRRNSIVKFAVITREKRVTQYSQAPVMAPKRRRVLDTRFRGYDGVIRGRWGAPPTPPPPPAS